MCSLSSLFCSKPLLHGCLHLWEMAAHIGNLQIEPGAFLGDFVSLNGFFTSQVHLDCKRENPPAHIGNLQIKPGAFNVFGPYGLSDKSTWTAKEKIHQRGPAGRTGCFFVFLILCGFVASQIQLYPNRANPLRNGCAQKGPECWTRCNLLLDFKVLKTGTKPEVISKVQTWRAPKLLVCHVEC